MLVCKQDAMIKEKLSLFMIPFLWGLGEIIPSTHPTHSGIPVEADAKPIVLSGAKHEEEIYINEYLEILLV